jgi:hypothetical protein
MIHITLAETRYIKNPDTKTTYIEVEKEVKEVTEREHFLYFDSVKWFRRLGGSESITKGYTCNGYVGTKLISTSPDKQIKVVREFNFKSN